VRALRRAYVSMRDAEIVGHSDIAPGRKTDPGAAFDWGALRKLLDGKRAT
jgi:N-acetyl-anhydromuramoyl-L-alanine amidase